jgi:hypothetical protein
MNYHMDNADQVFILGGRAHKQDEVSTALGEIWMVVLNYL